MDNGDYHQQLHALKDRVNALNLQYSPRRVPAVPVPSTPQMPRGDAFTAQLRDVRAHLDRMQASLSTYHAETNKLPTSQLPASPSGDVSAQSRLTLPSGPLFWQLFNSLRSDFQTLDTRVAGLEQDVDALEDRVDKLEPDRFTPAASTTSQEDAGGVQVTQKPAQDLLGVSMACLPELYSADDSAQLSSNVPTGQHHQNMASLPSQPDGAFQWQWPSGDYWNEDSLPQPYASPTLGSYVPHGCDVASAQSAVYPEGVAFRDREIDRMDDQLRAVQESLKSSEALAAAQDTTMGDMRTHIQAMQAENQKLAAEMTEKAALTKKLSSTQRWYQKELEMRTEERDRHSQTIADRDGAIRYWQERCEQQALMYQRSIGDRDRALHRWEESYNAASAAWRQENERANALGARLDQYRSGRKETEQVIFNYEHERDQLKEFCEHKDAVIAKQERVMSRGAQLLEERDAEIDRLQRRLRGAEDDTQQNEQRQQKRMARLLDETQAELARLRDLSASHGAGTADEGFLAAQQQEQVMAASTEAVDGRDAFEIPGSFPRDARRAADRRERDNRDPDDSDLSIQEAARTGSPRQRRIRKHESLRHLPQRAVDRQHRHERRPSPPPRQHHPSERQDRRQRAPGDYAEARSDDRRRARFSDDRIDIRDPPHPGPVAARKMVSEADLRSYSHGASRNLSKHQSMQELPGERQRLQAYVETEAESEAENDLQQGQA